MTEFETQMVEQMIGLNKTMSDIYAVLNEMVVSGLVVLPDVGASDN